MSVQTQQESAASRTGLPFAHTEITKADVQEYLGPPEPLAPYTSNPMRAHRAGPRTEVPTSGRRRLLRVDREEG